MAQSSFFGRFSSVTITGVDEILGTTLNQAKWTAQKTAAMADAAKILKKAFFEATPFYNGKTREQWSVTVGADQFSIKNERGEVVYWLVNGTRAHTIQVVSKRTLSNYNDQGATYAFPDNPRKRITEVQHPGSRPNAQLRDLFEGKAAELAGEIIAGEIIEFYRNGNTVQRRNAAGRFAPKI